MASKKWHECLDQTLEWNASLQQHSNYKRVFPKGKDDDAMEINNTKRRNKGKGKERERSATAAASTSRFCSKCKGRGAKQNVYTSHNTPDCRWRGESQTGKNASGSRGARHSERPKLKVPAKGKPKNTSARKSGKVSRTRAVEVEYPETEEEYPEDDLEEDSNDEEESDPDSPPSTKSSK